MQSHKHLYQVKGDFLKCESVEKINIVMNRKYVLDINQTKALENCFLEHHSELLNCCTTK